MCSAGLQVSSLHSFHSHGILNSPVLLGVPLQRITTIYMYELCLSFSFVCVTFCSELTDPCQNSRHVHDREIDVASSCNMSTPQYCTLPHGE